MNTSPERELHRATLGLGGNIGDPQRAMASALQMLDGRADSQVTAVSRLYRTPPWGKVDQADFFNSCAVVETSLAPGDLLDVCLGIEREMKRVRRERWGPRTIDIDVLTYDQTRMRSEKLELPHPRMIDRAFVLMPLADLVPEMVVHGRSVVSWLADADRAGIAVADSGSDWWRAAPA